MSKGILNRLKKDNEKIRCFENLDIDKNRWRTILDELSKKYKIYSNPIINEDQDLFWKWNFTNNVLTIETDFNPIAEPINITEINFVMGKTEIVDDFETLVKGGTLENG